MRCFVTGVAGFVGSHLAERLLADGHEVCGIDSFTDDYDHSLKECNLEGPRSWNRFHFIEGDLVEVALQPMLEGVDWIFHQAGQEAGRTNWASAFTYYAESNVLITLRLLEAALRFGWIRRFVYASSSSVYGRAAHLPIREEEMERPRSPHGVTKLAAESLCSLYHRRFGLPTVSLRYFSIYGPRQRPDMALHRFCKAIVCNEPLYLHGGGYQTRDFIYIDDVVEANIRAAMASEATGQVMNIASGTSVTLRSIVELLEEISGSRISVVINDGQDDEVRHISADTLRAQQLLGYRPIVGLRDGLAHEFEFIRRLYKHQPNSAASRTLSSDEFPLPSEYSKVSKKTMAVRMPGVPKPETSPLESQIVELVTDTMQRTEMQTDTLTNIEQQLQTPEISLNFPKESEYTKLVSPASKATLVNLTADPTLHTSQADSHVEAPRADAVQLTETTDNYPAACTITAPNLAAVLEPETRREESQMVSQTPRASQADSYVAEPVANTVQPTGAADDYPAASEVTATNLTAVLEPETKQTENSTIPHTPQISQADSQIAEPVADTAQLIGAADDYPAASETTAANLTAALEPETKQTENSTVPHTPQISQADSRVAASIANAARRTEPQMDTWANIRQRLQTPQFRVNVLGSQQSNRVRPIASTRSIGATQAPTGSWTPSSRLTRPLPNQAEQNHMGVAIITLLLVGLLMLGGCLAVYTQFIASPSAIITHEAAASSAAITITTEASKTLENTFSLTAITGDPDAAQHQIKARQVSAMTQPVSKSIQIANGSTNNANPSTSDDQNSMTSPVVQQSDIDNAANDMESMNTPSASSILQSQLAPNEHLVGNPQCQPQVSANHKAGDIADSVIVTVVFSCNGEAYDRGTVEKMAAQELAAQAKEDLGNAYALSGHIQTTVQDASVSDANQGTITVPVNARGTWVLQSATNLQKTWANSLAGKTKQAAQKFLLQQEGIKQANIQLQGGDGHTLPTDAKKITIKVKPIANS